MKVFNAESIIKSVLEICRGDDIFEAKKSILNSDILKSSCGILLIESKGSTLFTLCSLSFKSNSEIYKKDSH